LMRDIIDAFSHLEILMKNIIIMLVVATAMAVIVPARVLAEDSLPSLEDYVDKCVLIVKCKTEDQGKLRFKVLETWKGKYSPDLFYDNPPQGYLYAGFGHGNDSPVDGREVIFFFTARNQPDFAKGKLVVHSTCFNVNDGKLGYASNTDPGVDPDEYTVYAFKRQLPRSSRIRRRNGKPFPSRSQSRIKI